MGGWDTYKHGEVSDCGQPGHIQTDPDLVIFKLIHSVLAAPLRIVTLRTLGVLDPLCEKHILLIERYNTKFKGDL